MKKNKLITATLAIFFYSLHATAQTEGDILKLNMQNSFTTARTAAMGGAFTALGGDLGATQTNPAGTGVFKSQHFTMALAFQNAKNNTGYIDKNTIATKNNFYLSNLGYNLPLYQSKSDQNKGLQNVNLSVAYASTTNFANNTEVIGNNDKSNLSSRFAQDANGITDTLLVKKLPYTAGLAYNAYLINPYSGSRNQYYSPIIGTVLQQQSIAERGGTKDFNINFAANYANKLYLGVGMGFLSGNYTANKIFSEQDVLDTMRYDFKNMSFIENVTTQTSGANLKLGVIFLPLDWLRLGGAIQTGSRITASDGYNTKIKSVFDNGDSFEYSSPENTFIYDLYTPLRSNLGVALIAGDRGIFSVDYEMVAYNQMRVGSTDAPFWANALNQKLAETYRNVNSVRVGGEYRVSPSTSLRAGYVGQGSPFAAGVPTSGGNLARNSVSLGFGFKGVEGIYFDLAAVNSYQKSYYEPYTLNDAKKYYGALTKQNNLNVVMTLGARF